MPASCENCGGAHDSATCENNSIKMRSQLCLGVSIFDPNYTSAVENYINSLPLPHCDFCGSDTHMNDACYLLLPNTCEAVGGEDLSCPTINELMEELEALKSSTLDKAVFEDLAKASHGDVLDCVSDPRPYEDRYHALLDSIEETDSRIFWLSKFVEYCDDFSCPSSFGLETTALRSEFEHLRENVDLVRDGDIACSWSPLPLDLSCRTKFDDFHGDCAPMVDDIVVVAPLDATLVKGDVPEQVFEEDSPPHVHEHPMVSPDVSIPSISEEVKIIEYYKPPSSSLCELFILPFSFSFCSCSFCFSFPCLCVVPNFQGRCLRDLSSQPCELSRGIVGVPLIPHRYDLSYTPRPPDQAVLFVFLIFIFDLSFSPRPPD